MNKKFRKIKKEWLKLTKGQKIILTGAFFLPIGTLLFVGWIAGQMAVISGETFFSGFIGMMITGVMICVGLFLINWLLPKLFNKIFKRK